MIDVGIVATAAVAALSPYLVEAAKAGAKKVGEAAVSGVGKLYQLIKRKLKASGGEEALEGIEAAPDDADAQGALRQALKKRLAEDEAFRSELAALVEELAAAGGGVTQTATTTGNQNVTVQIAGDQNQVGWTGKGS